MSTKMDVTQAASRIRRFNDKVGKLGGLSFTQNFPKSGVEFSWTKGDTPANDVTIVKRYGVEDESIDAFVLTLRLLVQPRDRISIIQIAELYDDLPVGDALKDQAKAIQAAYQQFMALEANITIGEKKFTNDNLFETFTYGGIAHLNEDKVGTYEKIAEFNVGHAFLMDQYIVILATIHRLAIQLRRLNEVALQELGQG